MRTKLLILISAGLAIMLSCVETTSVEAPAEVDPNTAFEVTINTLSTDSGGARGYLAILIPEIWTIDSVYGSGYGISGTLDSINSSNLYLPQPAAGYEWFAWKTPVIAFADSGEIGHAITTITTVDSLGTFQLAVCAGTEGYAWPNWEESPCSCMVDVTPLNLQQETWGYIKTELGQ